MKKIVWMNTKMKFILICFLWLQTETVTQVKKKVDWKWKKHKLEESMN